MNSHLQISTAEEAMMQEVFAVMAKYKNQTREFGINLVHSHFKIGENEILYETHEKEGRVLTTKPINKNEAIDALATAWSICKNGQLQVTNLCCDNNPPLPPR